MAAMPQSPAHLSAVQGGGVLAFGLRLMKFVQISYSNIFNYPIDCVQGQFGNIQIKTAKSTGNNLIHPFYSSPIEDNCPVVCLGSCIRSFSTIKKPMNHGEKADAEYVQETVGQSWMSLPTPVVYFALSLAFDSQTS